MKGISPPIKAYGDRAVQSVGVSQAPRKVEGQVARHDGHPAPAKLSISNEARELAAAKSVAETEKIEQLRAAVRDGTISVDAHAIARQLLDVYG